MSPSKLWGGRFQAQTASSVEAFTESISFDWRLWRYDIQGSIAHAAALAEAGLLTTVEHEAIVEGLCQIRKDIESGALEPRADLEDVHMNIEAALTERIGEPAKKLHTGRSRNDQIALDVRLWARDAIRALHQGVRDCQSALVAQAESQASAIMPAFTHLQHAQPVLVAHYLLAHVEALDRDHGRLSNCLARVNVCPLGAGAIAGTTLPIDRRLAARQLGFDDVSANSIDTVSDRDHLCELAFAASLIVLHLSRLCEDWILWASSEFRFIEIDDAYCTGSSMMPQKKNPDIAELNRGKVGRASGSLVSLLTMLKGTPSGYNRDFQEDKPPLFESVDTAQACLQMAAEMVEHTGFNTERMLAATEEGHLDATALADYLVRKGTPFREAHSIVGQLVSKCLDEGIPLRQLPLASMQARCPAIADDVFDCLGAENVVLRYRTLGSSAPNLVAEQIAKWQATLSPQADDAGGAASV